MTIFLTVCAYVLALPIMLLVYLPVLLCWAGVRLLIALINLPTLPRVFQLVERFLVSGVVAGLSAVTFIACCDVTGVEPAALMFLAPMAFLGHACWRRIKKSRAGDSVAQKALAATGAPNARRHDLQVQFAALAGNLAGVVVPIIYFRVPFV